MHDDMVAMLRSFRVSFIHVRKKYDGKLKKALRKTRWKNRIKIKAICFKNNFPALIK